jgi:hypothetical protein
VKFGFQGTRIHLRLHRKLKVNRQLAAFKFFMSGEIATSFFGNSATNRRVSPTSTLSVA